MWRSSQSKTHQSGSETEESDSQSESVHPTAAALLELQQASGNQAVQQLLGGKEKSSSQATADPKEAGVRIHTDDAAAKSADSLGAAAYTRGRDIYFGAGKYAPETSEGKKLLAHELSHAVQNEPAPELGGSVNASDVVAADDPSERQAESAAQSAREAGGPHLGFQPKSSHPGAIHLAPLTEAEIAQKLHDAMAGPGTNAQAIINLLSPLNRNATKIQKVRDAYAASFKSDLEADIRIELSGDYLAHALFLLNAPPPATPVATATVKKVGTEQHKAKVGDGEVTVRKDVDYQAGTAGPIYTGGFSTGYEGKKAEESRWIQMLWSEVLATQPDGTVKHVAASGLPVAVGTMELTTVEGSPKYKVDSGSTTSPFYESRFTSIRTATGTTIYDRPSEFGSVITKEFDAGATKVIEIDHFEDFLIREYKTIYCVRVNVKWEYTSKTTVVRTTDFVTAAAVSSLPPEVKKQLVKEYPKFDYIQ